MLKHGNKMLLCPLEPHAHVLGSQSPQRSSPRSHLVKPMCYPQSTMVFPKGHRVHPRWGTGQSTGMREGYVLLNIHSMTRVERILKIHLLIDVYGWGVERTHSIGDESLCNSPEMFELQFRKLAGPSPGYRKKLKRLLKLKRDPHTSSCEPRMFCCLTASSSTSPTHHPMSDPHERSLLLTTPKRTHGHTHCFWSRCWCCCCCCCLYVSIVCWGRYCMSSRDSLIFSSIS